MLKFIRAFRGAHVINGPVTRRSYSKMLHSMEKDRPVEYSISSKLNKMFEPKHLQVINESHKHNVPKGSETHFKVVVVSEKFENVSLLNRHRMVNDVLQDELNTGVHALSVVAKTPSQWENSDQTILPSPACRGGFGK
ncbi:hypothetical protein J437_LFUL003655 [Ladona fulva]|uniref:Uncharacterized protein n=1 Tax=Ladona fulva TaxID=123851 RepID=A0A8K0NXF3_LADFU|nr:hypothetical protein J437_LFUL003655 [Ladona fulva]